MMARAAHYSPAAKQAPEAPENRRTYNGKEYTDELGLDWYDYGARWYDAALGRWGQVDPMAEEFANWSPYHYVYNNPLLYIDPTGMAGNLRDGITIIFKKADNISSEEYADYTWRYIQNVMDVWGDKGTGGEIIFKFAVGDFDTGNLGANENLVNIGNYDTDPSYVTGENREVAYMNTKGQGENTPAHEFGHHMGLTDRYLEGFNWSKSYGFGDRRTTPIGEGAIDDPNYNSMDNLYSSGSATLTPQQISIANSNEVEGDHANGRGVVYERQGSSPAKTTNYQVRRGKVSGLNATSGYGQKTRRSMRNHILIKRLH